MSRRRRRIGRIIFQRRKPQRHSHVFVFVLIGSTPKLTRGSRAQTLSTAVKHNKQHCSMFIYTRWLSHRISRGDGDVRV